MRQVTQRLRDGRVEVLEVPVPALTPDGVLIRLHASLLSAGTERSKVEAGRKSLLEKARSRPDQVAQVLDKARRDGLTDTYRAVRARLDQPSNLGYSAAGVVLEVGSRVTGLAPGDRVACGGGDHAVHAEVVQVPGNLCVRLPEGLRFEHAAFATVGAIAMHGVRQAEVSVGEHAAVIGLGLVGQLAGLVLRAGGCTVIGVDLDAGAIERAIEIGAIDAGFLRADLDGDKLPDGAGDCDAALLTAATASGDPVRLAARLVRDRGRVVVVGDVGMDIPRTPYFDKELELRLSRSYGPGRYDRDYEERGLDYPIGYVRWTERRNMAAFVELAAAEKVDVDGLITERLDVVDAPSAYERLVAGTTSPLGLVITYAGHEPERVDPSTSSPARQSPVGDVSVASVIGAGSFAQRILIPGLAEAGFRLSSVASAGGLSARGAAEKHGIDAVLSTEDALADPAAGLVAIATRHSTHAELAARALHAGKSVFVEKPPALTTDELEMLRSARAAGDGVLQVGFNRRWAPLAQAMRDHVAAPGVPLEVLIRVAAGILPRDSWMNDPSEGGGRLLGEGCHFVDLACWLVGRLPDRVSATMRPAHDEAVQCAQRFSVSLSFPDGSMAVIVYTTEGATGLPKEYVELHGAGKSAVLDDFRRLTLRDGRKSSTRDGKRQDKGHKSQLLGLRQTLAGGRPDPAGIDMLDTMAVTLAALRSAQTGASVERLNDG